MQSKRGSLVESLVSTGTGLILSLTTQLVVEFPSHNATAWLCLNDYYRIMAREGYIENPVKL